MATVVAAVDLARVRLPLADDEEEEAAEGEIRQQAKEITPEEHVVETKILGAGPPPAVSVTSEQRRVQVSQVRHFLLDIPPVAAPVLIALLITPDPEDRSVLPRGHCLHTGFTSTFYCF